MALSHATLGLTSMIFLAGSLVLLWFVILSGVTTTTPLDKTYFLRANTLGITGARDVSQWTYFHICSPGNVDCTGASPAMPFGHAWASNPVGAPSELVGKYGNHTTNHYYWYMWRFGWVFFLISLFFIVCAFFTSFLACLGRLGSALAALTSLVALVFYSVAVSLMTATFVKARNAFHHAGRSASLGRYAFGFSWGAWAALFIATLLFFVGIGFKNGDNVNSRRGWGRRRSTRSTRSFDARRVKDDYS
ncbi:Protein SUR7 [Pleurostoma richardsiae]|uniref:Protein SUR7 n=1 Tax=Pleurostoma richardsiae TaxID=41990 RepID=A0AA38VNQ5_9PEZI|nr:Protein SUR7 [Pleurostoma richardsiae]